MLPFDLLQPRAAGEQLKVFSIMVTGSNPLPERYQRANRVHPHQRGTELRIKTKEKTSCSLHWYNAQFLFTGSPLIFFLFVFSPSCYSHASIPSDCGASLLLQFQLSSDAALSSTVQHKAEMQQRLSQTHAHLKESLPGTRIPLMHVTIFFYECGKLKI